MKHIEVNQFQFFSDLPHIYTPIIEDKLQFSKIPKGNYIFHESKKADMVYFVKEGIVKVKKINLHGKEVIVCIKMKGQIFGEAILFQEEEITYPGTAQALTDAEIAFISKKDLEDLIIAIPELSRRMIQGMTKSLRRFSTLIKDNSLNNVYDKTIKALERLGIEYGKLNIDDSLTINLPLTIQELANIVGSARETVNKIIIKLKEENQITIHHRKITITHWETFCSISHTI